MSVDAVAGGVRAVSSSPDKRHQRKKMEAAIREEGRGGCRALIFFWGGFLLILISFLDFA